MKRKLLISIVGLALLAIVQGTTPKIYAETKAKESDATYIKSQYNGQVLYSPSENKLPNTDYDQYLQKEYSDWDQVLSNRIMEEDNQKWYLVEAIKNDDETIVTIYIPEADFNKE